MVEVGNEHEIIRGTVDGQAKYCRIPVRSKTAEQMQEVGVAELSAETILEMPHDLAVKTIDAILADWQYWLKRANELFVLWAGLQEPEKAENLSKLEVSACRKR
jgi:hypothetical protein